MSPIITCELPDSTYAFLIEQLHGSELRKDLETAVHRLLDNGSVRLRLSRPTAEKLLNFISALRTNRDHQRATDPRGALLEQLIELLASP